MFSLETYGYLIGRGRRELANNPESGYNKDNIVSIIEICNRIDGLPRELLECVFPIRGIPVVRILQGIWFETDLYRRPQFSLMIEAMRDKHGVPNGNLIVVHTDDLATRGDEQSDIEWDNLALLAKSPISIIDLRHHAALTIVDKHLPLMRKEDMANFLNSAINGRELVRLRAEKSMKPGFQPDPVTHEEDASMPTSSYDFSRDLRYLGNKERVEFELLQKAEAALKNPRYRLDL